MRKMDKWRGLTWSPVLVVESSEPGHVPWVRLESTSRCILQSVCSTGQNLVNNEGTFPFGPELVLFLIQQA